MRRATWWSAWRRRPDNRAGQQLSVVTIHDASQLTGWQSSGTLAEGEYEREPQSPCDSGRCAPCIAAMSSRGGARREEREAGCGKRHAAHVGMAYGAGPLGVPRVGQQLGQGGPLLSQTDPIAAGAIGAPTAGIETLFDEDPLGGQRARRWLGSGHGCEQRGDHASLPMERRDAPRTPAVGGVRPWRATEGDDGRYLQVEVCGGGWTFVGDGRQSRATTPRGGRSGRWRCRRPRHGWPGPRAASRLRRDRPPIPQRPGWRPPRGGCRPRSR